MNRVKSLKIVLLLALAAFVAIVVINYRTGSSIADSTADEDLRKLVAGEQLIQTEFKQKSYEREKLKSEISARELVNYQDGVNILEDLQLSFGREGMDVRSDFGRHDQESGDSFLWENVRINDGKGMTIRTEAALHDDTRGILAGNRLVEFSDSRLSGSSLGVLYDMNSGELQLPADVDLTITTGGQGTGGDPVHVRAGYLKLLRDRGVAYLARGVDLRQGRLGLRSRTLRIDFDPESRRLRHVSAHGSVVFEMAEAAEGDAGPVAAEGGMQALGEDRSRKTLHADRLEIFFPRDAPETARMSYIVARGADGTRAEIVIDPPPPGDGGAGDGRRRLEGDRLVFRFHPDGAPNRLDSFLAEDGCRLTMSEKGADDIVLTGETLTARFDPGRQELAAAEITGSVSFTRGVEHIRGELANYDAVEGRLLVTGAEDGALPRLWNDSVALEAVRILYGVDGQLLEAEENVWASVIGDGGETGLDVALFSEAGDDEPVYIHADRLESDLEAGVSSFSGTVRVLKGENVLSARNLWLYHRDRRMEALERVSLIIQPLAAVDGGGGGEAAASAGETMGGIASLVDSEEGTEEEAEEEYPPDSAYDRSAPLQITCHNLVYDDMARYIILDDRVNVAKHKTRLSADHMEVQLGREDNRIEHIIASVQPAGDPGGAPAGNPPADRLITGFDSQARRLAGRAAALVAGDTGGAEAPEPSGIGDEEEATGGGKATAGTSSRPTVPQVTLSQPGGRTASGERVLYYPDRQVAVLVGLDTVASVIDPRSGSAQGTTLTYHLADGKILNRANDNEVTLVLLHTGATSGDTAGAGGSASNRGGGRGGRAASTGASARGIGGRSASR